jgi:dTDP-4-dehydrorhamnose 3,5-epimerase
MIEITPGEIGGVFLLRPTARRDPRGSFVKILEEDTFAKQGLPTAFAEQYYSVSAQNVLRGLHFQTPPHDHHKLVTCIEGEVFDVIVDLRKGSPSYGRHQSFELNGESGDSVFVPAGCAHGFYVRSKTATVFYSGIRWDSAGIKWPSERPTVSDRDAAFVPLAKFETRFVMSRKREPQTTA